jgi:hypothetical protein
MSTTIAQFVNLQDSFLGCLEGEVDVLGYPLYRDGVISDESVFWEHIDMACGNLWMPGVETTRQSLKADSKTPKAPYRGPFFTPALTVSPEYGSA